MIGIPQTEVYEDFLNPEFPLGFEMMVDALFEAILT